MRLRDTAWLPFLLGIGVVGIGPVGCGSDIRDVGDGDLGPSGAACLPDGGPCEGPPSDDGGAEYALGDDDLDACGALTAKACGTVDSACDGDPGCEAARLLARYEPQSCAAALDNEQSFPPCEASVCEVLVTKVCGPGGAAGGCAERPACGSALELQDRAATAETQVERRAAEDACDAALDDETVFALCPAS